MTVTERFALDTNLLAYTRDDSAPRKQSRAREVVGRAVLGQRCVLSVQVVGELYASLRKRDKVPVPLAIHAVREMTGLFDIIAVIPEDARRALEQTALGRASYWDALMLATLARAGCVALLTEDMQDGAVHRGLTIRNPFAGEHLPAEIEALLG